MGTYVFKRYRRSQPSQSTAGQNVAEHSFEAGSDADAEKYARANFMGEFDEATDFADVRDSNGNLVMLVGTNA